METYDGPAERYPGWKDLGGLIVAVLAIAAVIFGIGFCVGQDHPRPDTTTDNVAGTSPSNNVAATESTTTTQTISATNKVLMEMNLVFEKQAPASMKHSIVNTDVAVTVGKTAPVLDTGLVIRVDRSKRRPGVKAVITKFPEQDLIEVQRQPIQLIWEEDYPTGNKDPLWRIVVKGREVLLHFDDVSPEYDYNGEHVPEQAHFTAIIISPASQTLTHGE